MQKETRNLRPQECYSCGFWQLDNGMCSSINCPILVMYTDPLARAIAWQTVLSMTSSAIRQEEGE